MVINMVKFRRFAILLILPALVLLTSGCTWPPGGVTSIGSGVAINEFIPSLSTVNSGDEVKLMLKIENKGSTDALNVKAELTGINLDEWTALFGDLFTETIGTLHGVDKEGNIPGGTSQKQWTLEAPMLPKGTSHDYNPEVRVSYDYKTTATRAVTIVDKDELQRIVQRGGSLPSSRPTEYSDGPIQVDIVTKNVKTSKEMGRNYDIFPVHIRITNKDWSAGGTLINDQSLGVGYGGIGTNLLYPIQIRITPPIGTAFVFSNVFAENDDCSSVLVKEMWKGHETELTCELEVVDPPNYKEDRLITVELTYRYQLPATTQVQVFGVDRGFGWY